VNNDDLKKEFEIKLSIDPTEAGWLFHNLGSRISDYHAIVEQGNLEFNFSVKKSNSIEILILFLALPPAMNATIDLAVKLKKYLLKRQQKAKLKGKEFEVIFGGHYQKLE